MCSRFTKANRHSEPDENGQVKRHSLDVNPSSPIGVIVMRSPCQIMQARGIREALTGDHHFVQAGFVALLVK